MNDKFFKLGRAATIWCCDNVDPNSTKEEWDAIWEDKFAELIVKECMSITTNCTNYWTQKSGSAIIAEHFGVEE